MVITTAVELERRDKISRTLKKRWKTHKHHMTGRRLPENTKKKIRQSTKEFWINKERRFTKKHIKNLSVSHIGNKHTNKSKNTISEGLKKAYKENRRTDCKEEISNSLKGHSVSKETREKISIKNSGPNSGMWLGGISFEPYSKDFNKHAKSLVRERDNCTCQICLKYKTSRFLDIHHIDYDKKNSKVENLITLCKPCHGKTNLNRNHWTEILQRR